MAPLNNNRSTRKPLTGGLGAQLAKMLRTSASAAYKGKRRATPWAKSLVRSLIQDVGAGYLVRMLYRGLALSRVSSPKLCLAYGRLLEAEQLLDSAADHYKYAHSRHPQAHELSAAFDRVLIQTGDFDRAQQLFSELQDEPAYPAESLSPLALNAELAGENRLASERWQSLCLGSPSRQHFHDKLITSLLKEQRIEEASNAFTANQRRFANAKFLILEARILQAQGCYDGALQVLRRLAGQFANDPNIELAIGHCLSESGQHEAAEAQFMALAEHKDIGAQQLEAELAANADRARQYELAIERWQKLVHAHPGSIRYQVKLIGALLNMADTAAARERFQQFEKQYRDLPVRYNLLLHIMQADNEVESALAMIEEAIERAQGAGQSAREAGKQPVQVFSSFLKRKANLLRRLHQNTGDAHYLIRERQTLLQARALKHSDLELEIKLVHACIALGNFQEAAERQEKLPVSMADALSDLRIWAKDQAGDLKGAKALWQARKRRLYIPHIQPCAPGVLQRKDARELPETGDEIRLFTAIRNEAWRLPWFLDYYRGLGVDRFFFVDNGSSDGSLDYLLEQPDVHIFWTDQSYAASYSGMQWINHLVRQFGRDGWVIYVDVDEALVYADIENQGLRDLTSYMAARDEEALPGFMLDMFSATTPKSPPPGEAIDFVESYPLFDPNVTRYPLANCPYYYVRGGARRAYGWGEILTKTPLVRGGRDIEFLMSSHRISPARLSGVSAALLHFKLAGNYGQEFKEDQRNNNRMPACQKRHRHYARVLQSDDGQPSLINEETLRYQGSRQLTELGLIQAPADFYPADLYPTDMSCVDIHPDIPIAAQGDDAAMKKPNKP